MTDSRPVTFPFAVGDGVGTSGVGTADEGAADEGKVGDEVGDADGDAEPHAARPRTASPARSDRKLAMGDVVMARASTSSMSCHSA
jgi:hypothetical protein